MAATCRFAQRAAPVQLLWCRRTDLSLFFPLFPPQKRNKYPPSLIYSRPELTKLLTEKRIFTSIADENIDSVEMFARKVFKTIKLCTQSENVPPCFIYFETKMAPIDNSWKVLRLCLSFRRSRTKSSVAHFVKRHLTPSTAEGGNFRNLRLKIWAECFGTKSCLIER